MVPGEEERSTALGILSDYQRRDAYLGALLSSRLRHSSLDTRQKSLVTELVQGTVRMMGTLDWALRQFSRRRLDSVDPEVLWVLRLSAYQLMFTRVPDYTACDLAAELTRRNVAEGPVAYVNGVLRALARGMAGLTYPEPGDDPAAYLEARYSHPRWIAEMWIDELGFERAESLCRADNRQPPVSIRCNVMRVGRVELADSLQRKGIEVENGDVTPEALLVKGSGPLAALDEYRRGWFAVQDQGAILVGHRVEARPGMRICDMCAAPGGKANHLAELMGNKGYILALDKNKGRLGMVDEAAVRLGNDIIETRAIDATTAGESVGGLFDRVLLDAPCSGLGTLSRRPDIRWRRQPGDIPGLAALQRSLIAEGALLVKPGGALIYSTCTVSRVENEDIVWSFLREHPEFEVIEPEVKGGVGRSPFTSLFPDTDLCDGTFIAALRRMK
ncbi:MAG: 16S rRNA (cytosine(967)-C(5))-methyltransferase RsmB [Actinomycetia bacterium]|nr:16S rRNA (cytosine(967)-C(5))-methyltransferase RsmB [Actinomycetes bacterium]MCG2819852.1 16S rRNA (cytosine(967)-C(5))-methyltransferase RsmB [Actinomycetes bacterium]